MANKKVDVVSKTKRGAKSALSEEQRSFIMKTYVLDWIDLVKARSPSLGTWRSDTIGAIMAHPMFTYGDGLSDEKTPKEWRVVSGKGHVCTILN